MSRLNQEQEKLLKQTIETMIDDTVELDFDYESEYVTVFFGLGGSCEICCYNNSVSSTFKNVLKAMAA